MLSDVKGGIGEWTSTIDGLLMDRLLKCAEKKMDGLQK